MRKWQVAGRPGRVGPEEISLAQRMDKKRLRGGSWVGGYADSMYKGPGLGTSLLCRKRAREATGSCAEGLEGQEGRAGSPTAVQVPRMRQEGLCAAGQCCGVRLALCCPCSLGSPSAPLKPRLVLGCTSQAVQRPCPPVCW